MTMLTIVNCVTLRIEASIIVAISSQITKILSAAETLNNTNTKLNTNIAGVSKNAECVSLQENLADHDKRIQQPLSKAVEPPTLSLYYEALLSQSYETPTTQQQTLTNITRAHAAIKDCQLLLDPDLDHPQINQDTIKDKMVDMLKQALTTIKTINGPQLQIKSTTRLCNQESSWSLTAQRPWCG
ncbi:hypothetical protein EV401DRAFT_2078926 [Pisolithus croceorrhizus]|nr:hypothetical protein EV401DRAFT_2078926 [Pisolithus croceorrhizus]